MKIFRFFLLSIFLVLTVAACTRSEKGDKPVLFVSILPQRFFLSQIVGDRYDIEVMVPPGHSPATYEVLPRQMIKLSNAQVYFRIGVPFEEFWIDKISDANRDMEIVDTRKGVTLRSFSTKGDDDEEEHHEGEEEDHDDEHEHGEDAHSHEGKDPHIWLSPSAVAIQAQTMCEVMIRHDPSHADEYRQNLEAFQQELTRISGEIAESLSSLENRKIFVFHPAFGYFTDEFGLKQVPIEIEGKEPSPERLRSLIDHARDEKVKVIFVQKQFSTASAEAVAQGIGGTVVQIDPLAEDYLANLRNIGKTISENLK